MGDVEKLSCPQGMDLFLSLLPRGKSVRTQGQKTGISLIQRTLRNWGSCLGSLLNPPVANLGGKMAPGLLKNNCAKLPVIKHEVCLKCVSEKQVP